MTCCGSNVENRRIPLPKKRTETPVGGVLFTYVGTDTDFEIFLKTLVHDYLMISDFPPTESEKTVQKVESPVA